MGKRGNGRTKLFFGVFWGVAGAGIAAFILIAGRRSAGIEFAIEKHAGQGPVALDRAGSDAECSRQLLDGEAAEVAELDDLCLARTFFAKLFQGSIKEEDLIEAVGGDSEVIVHFNAIKAAGAAFGVMLARVIDEDASHNVRGETDEMATILEIDVVADEAHVGLINKSGCLKSVIGAFAAHVCGGNAMQLGVDEGKQIAGGVIVACAHGLKETRDFAGAGVHGRIVPRRRCLYQCVPRLFIVRCRDWGG